ncbi:hypothetical protein N8K70_13950 [Microbacterium betulae]|uniref:Uncharacterized protein n=1 Tax=Microbacterium betulae TaxID=2981139 RepID=A0AA97FGI9_9MICO|nr:hypothetical protein [Microbacterium sp. AB]WOF22483.1 hypothetical protein N8K70_13950 [Microbacterium sp. AB]
MTLPRELTARERDVLLAMNDDAPRCESASDGADEEERRAWREKVVEELPPAPEIVF